MTKTKTVQGRRLRIVSDRDSAGIGCEVVRTYRLRDSDGAEYTLSEGWNRPTLGRHTLAWRGDLDRA